MVFKSVVNCRTNTKTWSSSIEVITWKKWDKKLDYFCTMDFFITCTSLKTFLTPSRVVQTIGSIVLVSGVNLEDFLGIFAHYVNLQFLTWWKPLEWQKAASNALQATSWPPSKPHTCSTPQRDLHRYDAGRISHRPGRRKGQSGQERSPLSIQAHSTQIMDQRNWWAKVFHHRLLKVFPLLISLGKLQKVREHFPIGSQGLKIISKESYLWTKNEDGQSATFL